MTEMQGAPSGEASQAPGWYPDMEKAHHERFWDGRWTNRTRAADPDVELYRQDASLYVWGFWTALFLPTIGFVLGAIACFRGRRVGSGVVIMALSIVMGFVWLYFYSEVVIDDRVFVLT